MLLISILYAPYVANIHIFIPPTARLSRENLFRWAKAITPSTPLDIMTIRFYGGRKVTAVPLRELYPLHQRLGRYANMVRVNPEAVAQRTLYARLSMWAKEPRNKFYVGGGEGIKRSRAPGIWEVVWANIRAKGWKS
jgi:hypothetical protein